MFFTLSNRHKAESVKAEAGYTAEVEAWQVFAGGG